MPSRQQYVAQRIGARMQSRGEKMILRRTTMSDSAVPYRNPPDVSDDLVVTTGVTSNGQAWLGVSGSSVVGRLTSSDQVIVGSTTWAVGTMPTNITTDSDGIPLLDTNNVPVPGIPTPYNPDALAADNAWNAIPVSAPGNPNPATMVGRSVTLAYGTDQLVYGTVMSAQAMVALGWTEVDNLGLRISAYNNGAILPPQVDDQLIVNGQLRSIITVSTQFSNGVDFLYTVQAR